MQSLFWNKFNRVYIFKPLTYIPDSMPKILLKVEKEQYHELILFLRQQPGIESHLGMGNCILANFTQSSERYISFLEDIKKPFPLLVHRELCRGKCRDGSDCLNTAKLEGCCWRHQAEKEPTDRQSENIVKDTNN